MSVKNFTLRMDEQMLNKLHYVADYEGRSANSQLVVLVRKCIEEFEKEHGEIGGKK